MNIIGGGHGSGFSGSRRGAVTVAAIAALTIAGAAAMPDSVQATGSIACHRELHAHDATVRTIDLGTPNYSGSRHLGSGVAAVPSTIRWFERIVPPAARGERPHMDP